ncbi:MAG: hypothetical protein HFG65_09220 [Hungatella sp.]|nr:hypothetical protein [Hungatella sp.]
MGNHQSHFWKKRKGNLGEPSQIIGVIGAGPGMGTTHFSILMANYLCSGCGEKTAVLEWNHHGDFIRFGSVCTGKEAQEHVYQIQEVDFYPKADGFCLAKCLRNRYQKIVIDFGTIQELKSAELLRCHKVFLIISFSEWQEGAFGDHNVWQESAAREGWQCLAAFGSEESRIQWNKRHRQAVVRIPFSVDAFTVTREQADWMKRLI